MPKVPTGTVTFLFTDVEGSTRLWELHSQAMQAAAARHDTLVRKAIEANGGHVFKTMGDAFCAAFPTARQAIDAALAAQRALRMEDWQATGTDTIKVRMALHTGAAQVRDNDYFGLPLNRVARLLSTGHGGQILLSLATQQLVRDHLPPDTDLKDLGEGGLKDLVRSEHVYQLVTPDLPADFPPLRSLDTHYVEPKGRSEDREKGREGTTVEGNSLQTIMRGESPPSSIPSSVGLTFGEVLKRYRQGAGLSQDELGLKTNLSTRAISDLERGVNQRPRKATLTLLADGLGLGAEERRHLEEAAQLAGQPTHHDLPVQMTSFIGREAEVSAVTRLLRRAEVRLVTLTGPGGSGKTRLSLQVARTLQGHYPDGVWFVELAALTDPSLVPSTVARALGVTEYGSTPIHDTLRAYLQHKRLLLVLDNFEQVVSAAPAVTDLLHVAPAVKILITSRMALRLYGEHDYAVLPLSLPDPHHLPALEQLTQYEAVRLFIERAVAARSDFAVTNANAPAVAGICARLDGLPLAIELAAARSRLFAPEALLRRLEHGLALLTGGARDMPARQQTLRAAIDWSYNLLEPGEQQLLRRMAVFQGGRTLEALEAVCNYDGGLAVDLLEGVDALAGHNLLQQRQGSDGEPRFWMLETIQEYAWEKLGERGEAAALQRAHAEYFVRLGEQAEPELKGPRQVEWLDRLEDEHDNIKAALRWAREAGSASEAGGSASEAGSATGEAGSASEAVTLGLRLAGAVARFWYMRGYFSEGRALLEAALAAEGGDQAARGKALAYAGAHAISQGDYGAARTLLEESLALRREIGDRWGIAHSLFSLSRTASAEGNHEVARALYDEALPLFREIGDRWGIAVVLMVMGNVAAARGDYGAARPIYEECLALVRELGDRWFSAWVLYGMGVVAAAQGDYTTARPLYEESLAVTREMEDRWGIPQSLYGLGSVAAAQGDHEAARALLEESLALRREIGDQGGIAQSLIGMGNEAAARGEYEAARPLYEESLALARKIGDRWGIAQSLNGLGSVAEAQGDQEAARTLYEESRALYSDLGSWPLGRR